MPANLSLGNPSEKTISLMTPTWAGDLDHFRILLHSLARSPLAALPHTGVVQTEDLSSFARLPLGATQLLASAQVLPEPVERRRVNAQATQKRLGRHLTRVCGSSCRELGWPKWPRYTGWHTQQIAKLACASRADTDYVLVIDSDVLVTRSANLDSILSSPEIVCFSQPQALENFRGKTRKWVKQADALLQVTPADARVYDRYFDTPFLLHVPTVNKLIAWLEATYQQPWWQSLLNQPPRRWSEFATYKLFLNMHSSASATAVQWRAPEHMHYIFNTGDKARLTGELHDKLADSHTHFITLHSQSSGRQRWSASSFADSVIELL